MPRITEKTFLGSKVSLKYALFLHFEVIVRKYFNVSTLSTIFDQFLVFLIFFFVGWRMLKRNFHESRKFVVRFWFHWRPPEGILFHWRGLKKRFLQFKTLRRVIYISLEGFRCTSWGVIIPLEGFSYPSKEFIIPLEGFRYLSWGFIIPLEGFRCPS